MSGDYLDEEPTRAAVDALPGITLLQFGSPWCGHCQRAQPLIDAVAAAQPALRHLKIFDGRGKPLGRSFRIKLWPTLIVLRDGMEVARVVRPQDDEAVGAALAALDASMSGGSQR